MLDKARRVNEIRQIGYLTALAMHGRDGTNGKPSDAVEELELSLDEPLDNLTHAQREQLIVSTLGL